MPPQRNGRSLVFLVKLLLLPTERSGRPSSLSRCSSMYGKNGTRPTSDRAFQQDYMLKLDEENQRNKTLVEEAEDLEEQVRKLKTDSRLAALQVKQAGFKDDISKLKMVVSNFESLERSLPKKIEEKKQELAMKKEDESLVAIIEGQQFSAGDIENLLKEKESLQVELQAVLDRKQELQKAAWDHEINTSEKLRDLENVASQFNESPERFVSANL